MEGSAQRPLADLLAGLSARTPAPGGGCASAWVGAMSAALLEMVAAFAGAADVGRRADALRAQLLEQGNLELHSYEPVLSALRIPADDPSRGHRVSLALSEASDAPLAIARAAAEVTELAAALASRSSAALGGDAIAAVVLGEAASRAAAQLVEINLHGTGDARLAEAAAVAERATKARDGVLDGGAAQP